MRRMNTLNCSTGQSVSVVPFDQALSPLALSQDAAGNLVGVVQADKQMQAVSIAADGTVSHPVGFPMGAARLDAWDFSYVHFMDNPVVQTRTP